MRLQANLVSTHSPEVTYFAKRYTYMSVTQCKVRCGVSIRVTIAKIQGTGESCWLGIVRK